MNQPYHHGALRAALIEAAEIILERDGIAALTLRATARQAGVSHAAPTHHFGDLTGLLTALAASGFIRLRISLEAAAAASGTDQRARLIALGRGYVGFAQAYPGLFLLMFRSERLDWSAPALAAAGPAAFALLTAEQSEPPEQSPAGDLQSLVKATTRWSLMHGLATLLVDGRLEATACKVVGTKVDTLIEEVLKSAL